MNTTKRDDLETLWTLRLNQTQEKISEGNIAKIHWHRELLRYSKEWRTHLSQISFTLSAGITSAIFLTNQVDKVNTYSTIGLLLLLCGGAYFSIVEMLMIDNGLANNSTESLKQESLLALQKELSFEQLETLSKTGEEDSVITTRFFLAEIDRLNDRSMQLRKPQPIYYTNEIGLSAIILGVIFLLQALLSTTIFWILLITVVFLLISIAAFGGYRAKQAYSALTQINEENLSDIGKFIEKIESSLSKKSA